MNPSKPVCPETSCQFHAGLPVGNVTPQGSDVTVAEATAFEKAAGPHEDDAGDDSRDGAVRQLPEREVERPGQQRACRKGQDKPAVEGEAAELEAKICAGSSA